MVNRLSVYLRSHIISVTVNSLQIGTVATDSPWNVSDDAALASNFVLQVFHIAHHELKSTLSDSAWFSRSETDQGKQNAHQLLHSCDRCGFHKAGSARFSHSSSYYDFVWVVMRMKIKQTNNTTTNKTETSPLKEKKSLLSFMIKVQCCTSSINSLLEKKVCDKMQRVLLPQSQSS